MRSWCSRELRFEGHDAVGELEFVDAAAAQVVGMSKGAESGLFDFDSLLAACGDVSCDDEDAVDSLMRPWCAHEMRHEERIDVGRCERYFGVDPLRRYARFERPAQVATTRCLNCATTSAAHLCQSCVNGVRMCSPCIRAHVFCAQVKALILIGLQKPGLADAACFAALLGMREQ
jgi:hypothetical protein